MPDESFLSTQSADIRRGTLYQKPGPPTPSKNGGRLSFGGTGGGAGAAAAISGRLSMDPGMSVLRDNNNPSKSPPTGNKLLAFFGAGGGGASSSRRDEVSRLRLLVLLFLRPLNALVLACGCGFDLWCAVRHVWFVSATVVASCLGATTMPAASTMVSLVWHSCLYLCRRVLSQSRQSTK